MLLTVQMLIGDVPGLGHVQGQTVGLKSFPFALRIATDRRQTLGRSPRAVAPAYDVLAETFRIEILEPRQAPEDPPAIDL